MSAPGNSPGRIGRSAGFTLLELLLVLAIVAMAGGGVAFALRDLGQTQLEREGQRLIAMLESARARSRSSGLAVYWHTTERGFEFVGLTDGEPEVDEPARATGQDFRPVMQWLGDEIPVPAGIVVTLGPEPIIPRQEIVLRLSGSALRIATDGLRPFTLQRPALAGGDP